MPDDLSSILKGLPKAIREAVDIRPMHQVIDPYDIRLPSGIMSMDKELKGGLPGGTLTQIFGPEGIGKDYLSQLFMASNQRMYGDKSNIFYITFGYYPDRDFMRWSGVQLPYSDEELERMKIPFDGKSDKKLEEPDIWTDAVRGKSLGNVLFIGLDAAGKDNPAETLLQTAISLVQSNKFQLGIINELGSGETADNTKKMLTETARMATWASLLSDFCRKFYTAVRAYGNDEDGVTKPNETRVLMLNPVRANTDANSAKYVKYTQPGGHALKHAKVIDIHLDRRGKIRKGTTVVGKTIKWKIGKGKLGIHEGGEGEYDFLHDSGVDLMRDLIKVGKVVKTVQAGKYYYILGRKEPEDRIMGGEEGLIAYLHANPEVHEELRLATLEALKGGN